MKKLIAALSLWSILFQTAFGEPSKLCTQGLAKCDAQQVRAACVQDNFIVWLNDRTNRVTVPEMKQLLASAPGVVIRPCSCFDAYQDCEQATRPDCFVDFLACHNTPSER